MKNDPLIIKKRGDDGNRIITVRIREDTLAELDRLAAESNRSSSSAATTGSFKCWRWPMRTQSRIDQYCWGSGRLPGSTPCRMVRTDPGSSFLIPSQIVQGAGTYE